MSCQTEHPVSHWTDYSGNGPYEIELEPVNSTDRYPHLLSDTTPPAIDSPADVMFDQGSSGVNVIWAPRDEFPYEYILLGDDLLSIMFIIWDGEDIEIRITGPQPGLHNFTLLVYDAFGNVVNDTVIANIMANVFGGAGTELVATASLVSVIMVAIVLLAVKKMR